MEEAAIAHPVVSEEKENCGESNLIKHLPVNWSRWEGTLLSSHFLLLGGYLSA